VNLGWPDGSITAASEIIRSGVDLIRAERPRAIAIPYWEDRHPDHVAASQVLDLVIFRSGLRRYETGASPWRPEWTCYYFLNMWTRPSFVIDVSAYYETKRAALRCHDTQFSAAAHPDRTATRLNVSTFFQMIESRDAQFGAQIGVTFAEGIVVREPVARASLFRGEP
jgi:bacillithiol biosynthesis deacetylase BshB1